MYNDDTMKNKEGFVLDIHEIRQKIKISSIYDIPFETIAKLDTPCLYLGPRCEDVHQWGERVYMPDVEIIVPEIIKELIKTIA